MRRTLVSEVCAALPAAALDHPFGPDTDTWKVGGKIFALCSGDGEGVILKCADPEQAGFLIEIGVARPAPYLKRGGWVLIPWTSVEQGIVGPDDLAERLRGSYRVVAAGLPRRLRPQIAEDAGGR